MTNYCSPTPKPSNKKLQPKESHRIIHNNSNLNNSEANKQKKKLSKKMLSQSQIHTQIILNQIKNNQQSEQLKIDTECNLSKK